MDMLPKIFSLQFSSDTKQTLSCVTSEEEEREKNLFFFKSVYAYTAGTYIYICVKILPVSERTSYLVYSKLEFKIEFLQKIIFFNLFLQKIIFFYLFYLCQIIKDYFIFKVK